mgnify:CR=1 FL=1
MRNTNDIIRDLSVCAFEEGCQECSRLCDPEVGCIEVLTAEACSALTKMQDRCARYAEEIMVLRERLKEAEGHG